MNKKKLERTQLEKMVAMKAMTQSVVHLEPTWNYLKTENRSLISTNEELVSCSSERTTSSGRISDK